MNTTNQTAIKPTIIEPPVQALNGEYKGSVE